MHFNALDLNLVRVFDALMRERSATRAGDRIGLSQPAVSAALSRLRHAFNDQLFVRRGNDMMPTPRAEALAPLARSALAQIEAMVAEPQFVPARLERTFTLMGSDFVSILIMPDLARRIAADAPGVLLRLRDTAIGEVPRVLREDLIDLAIEPSIPDKPDLVASEDAFQSPFLLLAADGHAALARAGLAPDQEVPLDLFCNLRHALRSVDGTATGAVDKALQAIGRRRDVALTVPHFQGVALAVAQSDLVAALPAQFATAMTRSLPVRTYRLPVPVPAPTIQLLWHQRHDADPAHRWLRAKTLETVSALGLDLSTAQAQ